VTPDETPFAYISRPAGQAIPPEPPLIVEHVSHSFGRLKALDGVSSSVLSFIVVVTLAFAANSGRAADPADQNWPCQQRKILEISPGQIWTGPPLEEIGDSWQSNPTIAELARKIAARRTNIDEAKDLVTRFASAASANRNRDLAALAAGVLTVINDERAAIIGGVERYARRQRELAATIERQGAELEAITKAATTEQQKTQRDDLQEKQAWDMRIFQERARSLTYVCELPVMLEQRAFALGREIESHLDR
jgi:hypothetical protein